MENDRGLSVDLAFPYVVARGRRRRLPDLGGWGKHRERRLRLIDFCIQLYSCTLGKRLRERRELIALPTQSDRRRPRATSNAQEQETKRGSADHGEVSETKTA